MNLGRKTNLRRRRRDKIVSEGELHGLEELRIYKQTDRQQEGHNNNNNKIVCKKVTATKGGGQLSELLFSSETIVLWLDREASEQIESD